MVKTCCIKGCRKFYAGRKVKFFRFPFKNTNQFEKWVSFVRTARGDTNWAPTINSRLCDIHFISGFPSKIETSGDYGPSVIYNITPKEKKRKKKSTSADHEVAINRTSEESSCNVTDHNEDIIDVDLIDPLNCDFFQTEFEDFSSPPSPSRSHLHNNEAHSSAMFEDTPSDDKHKDNSETAMVKIKIIDDANNKIKNVDIRVQEDSNNYTIEFNVQEEFRLLKNVNWSLRKENERLKADVQRWEGRIVDCIKSRTVVEDKLKQLEKDYKEIHEKYFNETLLVKKLQMQVKESQRLSDLFAKENKRLSDDKKRLEQKFDKLNRKGK